MCFSLCHDFNWFWLIFWWIFSLVVLHSHWFVNLQIPVINFSQLPLHLCVNSFHLTWFSEIPWPNGIKLWNNVCCVVFSYILLFQFGQFWLDNKKKKCLKLNDHLNNAKILHKCLCFCVDLKSMMAANMENGFT
jgi:hypothetical protein